MTSFNNFLVSTVSNSFMASISGVIRPQTRYDYEALIEVCRRSAINGVRQSLHRYGSGLNGRPSSACCQWNTAARKSDVALSRSAIHQVSYNTAGKSNTLG